METDAEVASKVHGVQLVPQTKFDNNEDIHEHADIQLIHYRP